MADVSPLLEARLGFLLKQAHLRLTSLAEPALAELGLSARELVALTVIAAEGPGSQQHLAARLRVDRSTMVVLVDALETRGLVERRRQPEDRRAYALHPTARGKRLAARGERLLADAHERFLAPLTDPERTALLDSLRRLVRDEA